MAIQEIKQPNSWSCTVAAIAMATDSEFEEVIKFIGHDGSEKKEDSKHPDKRRGFNFKEIIAFALSKGYSLGLFYAFPDGTRELHNHIKLALEWPLNFKACMTVKSKILSKATHLVYWDGKSVYDPSPSVIGPQSLGEYDVLEVWPIVIIY